MNIVVLGPQGSGKGTQAEKLAQKFDLEHIDMGKSLREVAKMDTPLGKEIYHIQNVTKTLVPSRILKEVLGIKLASLPREQGIVFDGVPRTMDQAGYFVDVVLENGRHINKVFVIKLSPEESVKRISNRRVCEKCKGALIMGKDVKEEEDKCPYCGGKISQRKDDTKEGVLKRLSLYEKETMPVIDFFQDKYEIIEIDGDQSIEKVYEEILSHLKDMID